MLDRCRWETSDHRRVRFWWPWWWQGKKNIIFDISIRKFDNTTVDGSEIRLTSWDVSNPVNNGISYQPQLVSLPDFWTINMLDYRQVSNFKTTRFANLSSLGTWNLSSWVEELALLSSVKTKALLNIKVYGEILSLLDIGWFFLPLMGPTQWQLQSLKILPSFILFPRPERLSCIAAQVVRGLEHLQSRHGQRLTGSWWVEMCEREIQWYYWWSLIECVDTLCYTVSNAISRQNIQCNISPHTHLQLTHWIVFFLHVSTHGTLQAFAAPRCETWKCAPQQFGPGQDLRVYVEVWAGGCFFVSYFLGGLYKGVLFTLPETNSSHLKTLG